MIVREIIKDLRDSMGDINDLLLLLPGILGKDVVGIIQKILDKSITITFDKANIFTGEVTNPEISIYSPSDKLGDIKTVKVSLKEK